MRATLQFVDVDQPPRVIVVTSALPGEGKTTTAVNLAIALAQSSMKVCLVEADMRRPMASTMLGIDGSIGLSNVVAGQLDLDDSLLSWHRGLLKVLPAGTMPPDPSKLLGSKNMAAVLSRLRADFDYVVIDAPPVLPVSDALVLARSTDGAVLVSQVRQDPPRAAVQGRDEPGVRPGAADRARPDHGAGARPAHPARPRRGLRLPRHALPPATGPADLHDEADSAPDVRGRVRRRAAVRRPRRTARDGRERPSTTTGASGSRSRRVPERDADDEPRSAVTPADVARNLSGRKGPRRVGSPSGVVRPLTRDDDERRVSPR